MEDVELRTKRLCDMTDEEILKISNELSRFPLYFNTVNEYLNFFNILKLFLKNEDMIFTNNDLFHDQKHRIAGDMMNVHKAFYEKGVCNIVMDYADTDGIAEIRDLCDELDKQLIKDFPKIFTFFNIIFGYIYYYDRKILSNGFLAFLERKSISAQDGFTPHTPIEKVNQLTYMINLFPIAFYREISRFTDDN